MGLLPEQAGELSRLELEQRFRAKRNDQHLQAELAAWMVQAIVFGIHQAIAQAMGAKVSPLDWERWKAKELVKSAPGARRRG